MKTKKHLKKGEDSQESQLNEESYDLKLILKDFFDITYTCMAHGCGKESSTNDDLVAHINKEHVYLINGTLNLRKYINTSYKCLFDKTCGKKLDTINKIVNHICKTHLLISSKPNTTTKLAYNLNEFFQLDENSLSVTKNLRNIFSKPIFICSIGDCVKSFHSEQLLKKHKTMHKIEELAAKLNCLDQINSKLTGSSTTQADNLMLLQIDNISTPPTSVCSSSLTASVQEDAKSQQEREEKLKQVAKLKLIESNKKHLCHLCDAKFSRPAHLKSHLHSHCSESKLKCDYCNEQLMKKALMQQHAAQVQKNEEKKTKSKADSSSKDYSLNMILDTQQQQHQQQQQQSFGTTEQISNGKLINKNNAKQSLIAPSSSSIISSLVIAPSLSTSQPKKEESFTPSSTPVRTIKKKPPAATNNNNTTNNSSSNSNNKRVRQQHPSLTITASNQSSLIQTFHTEQKQHNQQLQQQQQQQQQSTLSLFKCTHENCVKSFPNQSKLNRHIKTHNKVRSFICQFEGGCGAAFFRRDLLQSHINTKHLNMSKHEDKTYVCDFPKCNSKYKYAYNLALHRKRHENQIAAQSNQIQSQQPQQQQQQQQQLLLLVDINNHNENSPSDTHQPNSYQHHQQHLQLNMCNNENEASALDGEENERINEKHVNKQHKNLFHAINNQASNYFVCTFCNYKFDTAYTLDLHQKTIHFNNKSNNNNATNNQNNTNNFKSLVVISNEKTTTKTKKIQMRQPHPPIQTTTIKLTDFNAQYLPNHIEQNEQDNQISNNADTLKPNPDMFINTFNQQQQQQQENGQKLLVDSSSERLLSSPLTHPFVSLNDRTTNDFIKLFDEPKRAESAMSNVNSVDLKDELISLDASNLINNSDNCLPSIYAQPAQSLDNFEEEHVDANNNVEADININDDAYSNCKHEHVINMNSDDEEYASCTVILENISGSARTDYKSNHIYIEKYKSKCNIKQHQHVRVSSPSSSSTSSTVSSSPSTYSPSTNQYTLNNAQSSKLPTSFITIYNTSHLPYAQQTPNSFVNDENLSDHSLAKRMKMTNIESNNNNDETNFYINSNNSSKVNEEVALFDPMTKSTSASMSITNQKQTSMSSSITSSTNSASSSPLSTSSVSSASSSGSPSQLKSKSNKRPKKANNDNVAESSNKSTTSSNNQQTPYMMSSAIEKGDNLNHLVTQKAECGDTSSAYVDNSSMNDVNNSNIHATSSNPNDPTNSDSEVNLEFIHLLNENLIQDQQHECSIQSDLLI